MPTTDNRIQRVHQPAFLNQFSIGIEPTGLIADRIAPVIPVTKQSDKYRIFGKNVLLNRTGGADWSPGAIPNAIESRWSDDLYFAKLYKLRHPLYDAELTNSDEDLDLRLQYTEETVIAMQILREARVVSLFTTSTNYSAGNVITKAGGQEWNTVPANVLTDLDSAITKAKTGSLKGTGELSVIIPDQVFDRSIKRNANVTAAMAVDTNRVAIPELLQALLGVKEVIIANTQVVAAGPETPDADVITGYTTTNLWLDNVWVGYIGAGQNRRAPTFARSFTWKAATGGQELRTRQYRMADEGQEGDWIEVTEARDEKITFKDAGVLIQNTDSTF
jgi:hypothetical protein